MAIEDALAAFIANQATLTDVLGAEIRYFPIVNKTQPPIYPYITYQHISTRRDPNHDGKNGFAITRIQLTLWAQSYSAISDLAIRLWALLYGYKGIWGSIRIDAVFVENEIDEYSSETQIYQRVLDLLIQHSE